VRERQLRRLMDTRYLVIVHVPKYRRKALEKAGLLVPEYVDAKIISIDSTGRRKQCSVLVRDGLGRDIEVTARSVLKFKGRGDQDGGRLHLLPVKRKRGKRVKREQMVLFE